MMFFLSLMLLSVAFFFFLFFLSSRSDSGCLSIFSFLQMTPWVYDYIHVPGMDHGKILSAGPTGNKFNANSPIACMDLASGDSS